jgi:hypothetical protein
VGFFNFNFSVNKKIEFLFQPLEKLTEMDANDNQQNKTFQKVFEDLLESIDSISSKVTDGEYLIMMNCLKAVFDKASDDDDSQSYVGLSQPDVRYIRIFIEAEPRQRRKKAEKPKPLTTQEKIDSGLYTHCRFCDRHITHKHFPKHQRSAICKSITLTKKQVSEEGKVFTNQNSLIELENRDIDEVKQDILEVENPEEAEERRKQDRRRKRREAKRAEELRRAVEAESDDEPIIQPVVQPLRIVRSSGSRDIVEPDSDDEPIVPKTKSKSNKK